MPAYNFQKQFVPKILDGTKVHTVRRRRKRPTVMGDRLLLYTGMRTKECECIAVTTCVKVEHIEIRPTMQRMWINGEFQLWKEEHMFIRADGFAVMEDFYAFFLRYKRPVLNNFQVIWWDPKELITQGAGQMSAYAPLAPQLAAQQQASPQISSLRSEYLGGEGAEHE